MPKQVYKIEQFHGGLNSSSDPRDIAENEFADSIDIMVDELGKLRLMGNTAAHSEVPANSGDGGAVISTGYGLFQFSHDRIGGGVGNLEHLNDGASASDTNWDATGGGSFSSNLTHTHATNATSTFAQPAGNRAVKGSNSCNYKFFYTVGHTTGDEDDITTFKIVGGSSQFANADTNLTQTAGIHETTFLSKSDAIDQPFTISITTGGTSVITIDDMFLKVFNSQETGDDYLAMADANGAAEIDIYSRTSDVWTSSVMDLGSTADMRATYYMMDGALRVSDGNFGAANSNKWYGYVDKTHFHSLDSPYRDTYDGWYSENQAIASPTAGLIGSNTSLLTGVAETSDGSSLKATGFFVVIDSDGTTESTITAAQIADQQVLNVTDGEAAALTPTISVVGDGVSTNEAEHATITATWATEDAFMIFPQAGAGFNVFVSLETGVSSWADGTYELASTFIYDGGQESLPFTLASTFTISGDYDLPTFIVWATSPYSSRLLGARIYYRVAGSTSNWKLLLNISMRDGVRGGLSDDYNAWTAVTMITFTWDNTHATWEGLAEGSDEYWNNMATPSFHANFTAAGTYLQAKQTVITPDDLNTYELLTGVSEDENTLEAKFKTAVVANRMVYIGNVETTNENGETQIFGDGMIKTPVNRVDMFPLSRMIEVSVRDGDEIIKLVTYADRLLQFKKKKMHLINISQEVEFLEDTFEHKGILSPTAVCKTDFGIAWVNRQGCYVYNGQSVDNLLEKGGRQIIKESDWFDFTSENSMIGYVPKKRQLIVLNSAASSNGDIYLFDMVTQSWTKGNSRFTASQVQTNFVTDWNNDLIHAHTSSTGTVAKWSDTSVTTTNISFTTKDFDFGQPSIRKKIYKVYVSYRGDGRAITVGYGVNGDNDTITGQFLRCNADGTTTGATSSTTPFHQGSVGVDDWINAELKPASPINNVYSFQLKFDGGTTDEHFQINDMTIVYRMKHIK